MGIRIEGTKITLENEHYRRVIDVSAGPVSVSFGIRPNGRKQAVWYPVYSFEPSVPFEAAVVVDGQSYEAGPHVHPREWDRRGAFTVTDASIGHGDLGQTLGLVCTPRKEGAAPVELRIRYEVADELPLVVKTVEAVNVSGRAVVVNNLTVDTVRFFDRKLPLHVFTDYYWDVRAEDPYYMCWTRIEFPGDIGMELAPGESIRSFTCYEAVTSIDRDEEAIILHRLYKRLAPWIKDTRIGCWNNLCRSSSELREFIDVAADNGIEEICFFMGQLFTNTGDYVVRPDLFPAGEEDVIRLNRYCHGKGIRSLPYCSTTIAWHGSRVHTEHPDWQYLGPGGLRYNPESFGNMCYQSPWGDYIRDKLLHLLDALEFDGLALDGPYHGLPCLDTGHRHKTAGAVRYMNWAWEKSFFGEVTARGRYVTAPQSWQSMLLGVKMRPGGYREEDMNEFGGMPLVVMTRACMYEARYLDPSCATWAACNIGEIHNHSIEASESDVATYDHAVANVYAFGHPNGFYGRMPYLGPNTAKVFRKWIRFFKTYRDTLSGELVHLSAPNGYQPDAFLHVAPDAACPALLVVFNPTAEDARVDLELPLNHAGFERETRRSPAALGGSGSTPVPTASSPSPPGRGRS